MYRELKNNNMCLWESTSIFVWVCNMYVWVFQCRVSAIYNVNVNGGIVGLLSLLIIIYILMYWVCMRYVSLFIFFFIYFLVYANGRFLIRIGSDWPIVHGSKKGFIQFWGKLAPGSDELHSAQQINCNTPRREAPRYFSESTKPNFIYLRGIFARKKRNIRGRSSFEFSHGEREQDYSQ